MKQSIGSSASAPTTQPGDTTPVAKSLSVMALGKLASTAGIVAVNESHHHHLGNLGAGCNGPKEEQWLKSLYLKKATGTPMAGST